MENFKLGTVETILLILTVIVAHTILSLPKTIIDITGSSSLINIIYIGIIAIILVLIICKLFNKFSGSDIIDISEYVGGKIFKQIIGLIFIIYFIVTASILLRNFCEAIKILYYPNTKVTFILLFFIITSMIIGHLRFNSALKVNTFIIPIVLISSIFLFIFNFENFTPQKIFPIMGNGVFETFCTGISNLVAFSGIVYLYFLPPLLQNKDSFKKISIISVGIIIIYLLLSVSTLLFMFNFFIKADEVMPLYLAARYLHIGNFFQRLESIFLLAWIFAFACYFCGVLAFAKYIFQKIYNIKEQKELTYPFAILCLGISLIPKNYAISKFLEISIFKYLFIGIGIFLAISILIIANIKKKKKISN